MRFLITLTHTFSKALVDLKQELRPVHRPPHSSKVFHVLYHSQV